MTTTEIFFIKLFSFLWTPGLKICLSRTSISPSEPHIYLVLCPHISRRGQTTRFYNTLKMFNCCRDRVSCFTEEKVGEKEEGLLDQGLDFRKKMLEEENVERAGRKNTDAAQKQDLGCQNSSSSSAIVKLSAFKKMDEITYSPWPVGRDSNCCRRLNKI